MKDTKEPKRLRAGKAFHKKIQKEWEDTAEGDVRREETIKKLYARKLNTKKRKGKVSNIKYGRVDIFVDAGDHVAIVEIKNSDWDRMTMPALRRNVKRQIRQIWEYMESVFESTNQKNVSPGVIFPKRPKDKNRMKLIEEMFEADFIPVVWSDETVQERKRRAK